MAIITIKTPNSPYGAEINTEVMDVEIREAYIGVLFISDSGKTLAVSMRDGGFELIEGS